MRIWGFQPSHTGMTSADPTKEQLDGTCRRAAESSVHDGIHTHKHTLTHTCFISGLCAHTDSCTHDAHTGPTGQLGSHADMVMRGERRSLSQIHQSPFLPLSFLLIPLSVLIS